MLSKFEKYPLTFGPTPIEKLERLSAYLGGAVEIYAKREDCNSGLAFGGNKLRKLEYIVPDIISSGADTLVTVGGVQSNHSRLVAATAAKLGMKCRLVQENWVPHPDAVYDRVGNILLSRIMGAQVELVRCVWHAELSRSYTTMNTTLWGWRAELIGGELTPDPKEVDEVLWLSPEEVRAHPDTLPTTVPFLEALLRSERMTRLSS